jgi:hypothetical protein
MNALLLAVVCYIGGFGQIDIPQGGSDARRLAGPLVRIGCSFDEESYYSLEAEAGWLENSASMAFRALVHWQAWRVYGDLFGFSRFDPFFTAGARGDMGSCSDLAGPQCGAGFFYHLDDVWSFRFDSFATLDVNGETEMRYSFTAGLQRMF